RPSTQIAPQCNTVQTEQLEVGHRQNIDRFSIRHPYRDLLTACHFLCRRLYFLTLLYTPVAVHSQYTVRSCLTQPISESSQGASLRSKAVSRVLTFSRFPGSTTIDSSFCKVSRHPPTS